MRLFGVDIHAREGGVQGIQVALSGEIDLSTVGAIQERIDGSLDGAGLLCVDLRDVTFLDSSGLRMILELDRRQRAAGRRLVVIQGPRRVRRVFELTGVESVLETVDDPSQLDSD